MDDSTSITEVSCIVKLGGAAITDKTQLETLNEDVLNTVAAQIDHLIKCGERIIIVHGAGSFGHFQAVESGIAHGGKPELDHAAILQGFSQTRLSVTKLNNLVVSALVKRGIPAVGVSPMGSWITGNRRILADGCNQIAALLEEGFLPVLHGDAVFDTCTTFTILGGDPIMTRLCQVFRPKRAAVFMTNVQGIFDRPPAESSGSSARLLRKILVQSSTSSSTIGGGGFEGTFWQGFDADGSIVEGIETSELGHDTTGGVRAKVEEAVEAVRAGISVRVVKAGSEAALHACIDTELSREWIGTEIRLKTE